MVYPNFSVYVREYSSYLCCISLARRWTFFDVYEVRFHSAKTYYHYSYSFSFPYHNDSHIRSPLNSILTMCFNFLCLAKKLKTEHIQEIYSIYLNKWSIPKWDFTVRIYCSSNKSVYLLELSKRSKFTSYI